MRKIIQDFMEFRHQVIMKKQLLIKVFLQVVKNDGCPAWSLESEKITHDKKRNKLYIKIQF